MIGMYSLFSSYCVYSSQDIGQIVDGSISSVISTDCISLTLCLYLYVFHAPNFKLNLVSINHVTKALNCNVTFFPSYCVFQDLEMQQTICRGHEEQPLYLMDRCSHLRTHFSGQSHHTMLLPPR